MACGSISDAEECGPILKRAHELLYDIRNLTQTQKYKHLGPSPICCSFFFCPLLWYVQFRITFCNFGVLFGGTIKQLIFQRWKYSERGDDNPKMREKIRCTLKDIFEGFITVLNAPYIQHLLFAKNCMEILCSFAISEMQWVIHIRCTCVRSYVLAWASTRMCIRRLPHCNKDCAN